VQARSGRRGDRDPEMRAVRSMHAVRSLFEASACRIDRAVFGQAMCLLAGRYDDELA
jgi:hypothetical protein